MYNKYNIMESKSSRKRAKEDKPTQPNDEQIQQNDHKLIAQNRAKECDERKLLKANVAVMIIQYIIKCNS